MGKIGGEGAMVTFLAKAKKDVFPNIPQIRGSEISSFSGSMQQLHEETPVHLKHLLLNKVRQCKTCSKPNGFTLRKCNGCGDSLLSVPITTSYNVFVGFLLGVASSGFNLTVSTRLSSAAYLVMDDVLALSPLHFVVIPTAQYVPDWRYLLRRPAEGCRLIHEMMDCCHRATVPFLTSPEWTLKYLRKQDFIPSMHVCAGFNFPPSQYQLHIQYIAPILLPSQYAMAIKGVHFTYNRFVPLDYVLAVLRAMQQDGAATLLVEGDTNVEVIFDFAQQQFGISYSDYHADFMIQFHKLQSTFGNYSQDDFEGLICASSMGGSSVDVFVPLVPSQSSEGLLDAKSIVIADKLTLQSYGRPYLNDKPTGQFYEYPKKLSDLDIW